MLAWLGKRMAFYLKMHLPSVWFNWQTVSPSSVNRKKFNYEVLSLFFDSHRTLRNFLNTSIVQNLHSALWQCIVSYFFFSLFFFFLSGELKLSMVQSWQSVIWICSFRNGGKQTSHCRLHKPGGVGALKSYVLCNTLAHVTFQNGEKSFS